MEIWRLCGACFLCAMARLGSCDGRRLETVLRGVGVERSEALLAAVIRCSGGVALSGRKEAASFLGVSWDGKIYVNCSCHCVQYIFPFYNFLFVKLLNRG